MKYSEAERKAWKQNKAELAKQVKAMGADQIERLACELGTVTVEGHRLSGFNTCYLWMQAGRALAMVGGCDQWRKAGRMIAEGQHAAGYIYVPMNGRKVERGAEEDSTNGRPIGFRLVPMFDVSQTVEVAQ